MADKILDTIVKVRIDEQGTTQDLRKWNAICSTTRGATPSKAERYRKIAAELISNADTVQRAESVEEPEHIPLSRPLIPEEELRPASGSDIAPAYRSRPAHVPGRVHMVRPERRKL